jgi:hypothetical protein
MIVCVHFLLFLSLYGSHAMYEREIGKLNIILPNSHILFENINNSCNTN